MVAVLENPTTNVLEKSRFDKLLNSLEERVLLISESQDSAKIVETINSMEKEGVYNYPSEAFQYLREKHSQQDANYKKLLEYGTRWLEENGSRRTTFYDMFGIKDKESFRQLFTKEAIVKASKELGLKIDKEDYTPTTDQRFIIAYQEPVIENIPTERIFKIADRVGRTLDMMNEDGQATYLDDVSRTPQFQQHLHSFPLQSVLVAASRKGLFIGKYMGTNLRYQGAYQANGIPVKAQPEIIQEIESRPEQIVPLEFLVQ